MIFSMNALDFKGVAKRCLKIQLLFILCVCARTHMWSVHIYTLMCTQRAEKGIMCPPLPTYSFEEGSLAEPKAHVLSRLAASMKDPPIPVPLRARVTSMYGIPS